MRSLRRAAAAAGAMLLGAAGVATAAGPQLKAGMLSPVMAAPEISLSGSDGQPLHLSRYRGKVVLLAFGYTSCGEVCPITLATLAGARKKLGADASAVQVVYITVDPARDDAARMKKYLASFDATFVGGTGSPEALLAAQKSYGISVSKQTYKDGSYTLGHSSSIFLIDRNGGLAAVMPYGHSSDDFVHDIRILLGS